MIRRATILLMIIAALISVGSFAYQPSIQEGKPVVAMVFGYHFFLREGISAENYVAQIRSALENQPNLRCVIISGANTRPGQSHKSEARVIKEEFLRQGFARPIILEESARTTRQNLRFCAQRLSAVQDDLPHDFDVLVFSDAFQRPRVWWYAQSYFPDHRLSFYGIPLWRERLLWQLTEDVNPDGY